MWPGSRDSDLIIGAGSPNVLRVARERRAARSRDRAAGPRGPPPTHNLRVDGCAPKRRPQKAEGTVLRGGGRNGNRLELRGGKRFAKVWQVAGTESRKAQSFGRRKANRLELRGGKRSAKVYRVAESESRKAESFGVRLILENSTVCHSRRISLLCPVFCGLHDRRIRI